jgi:hypothetical protein
MRLPSAWIQSSRNGSGAPPPFVSPDIAPAETTRTLCIEPQRTWKARGHRSYHGTVRATRTGTESQRAFRTDCKPKRRISRNDVSFVRAPHMLDIARILRGLNRIRVELVGEFSPAIRRG